MPAIPPEVGTRAGQWDQQNVDLTSAGSLVADAPTTGFTQTVRAAATPFLTAWHAHVQGLATDAEGFADGLRVSITNWWESDLAAQNALTHDPDVVTLYAAMDERR